jgi:hypothetical protein
MPPHIVDMSGQIFTFALHASVQAANQEEAESHVRALLSSAGMQYDIPLKLVHTAPAFVAAPPPQPTRSLQGMESRPLSAPQTYGDDHGNDGL